jgi:hypothetical protein
MGLVCRYGPSRWLSGLPQLHGQSPFVETRQLAEGSLCEVDMLGAFCTASASVDDADENAFFGRVADCSGIWVSVSCYCLTEMWLTFEEFKAFGSRLPAFESESGCKRSVL